MQLEPATAPAQLSTTEPYGNNYVDRLKLRVTVSTKRSGFPFRSSGE
jgi:hypothetical protein